MQAKFYLVINAKKSTYGIHPRPWVESGVKVRKEKPSTKPNEVAIKVSVTIPDAYFEVPELSATIEVPDDAVNKPIITPEVSHNISEAISKQLGVQVHVSEIEKGDE